MLRKRLLIVAAIVLAIVLVGSMAVAASMHTTAQAPVGFEQIVLLIATGEYDEAERPENDDLGVWFHEEIMGRTQQEIDELADEADEYFWEQFGDDYDPDTLVAFGVDPEVGVRAFAIGGMTVPREGFVVREGGFKADVLVDEIGGEEIWGIAVWGEIVIQPHRLPREREVPEEMVITFRTEEPITRARYTDWTAFEVILESELWGDGWLLAMARETTLDHLRTRDVDVDNDNDNDNGLLDWLLPDNDNNNNNPNNNQITPTPAPLETPPAIAPVDPTAEIDIEQVGFWGLLMFEEAEEILEDIDPDPEPGFVPEPPVGPTPPPIDDNNNND